MALKITHVGHATSLIQWDNINILTDPIFSKRVLCFKRHAPLGIDPTKLPKLDAILLSHAHYDHLDLFSFKYIPSDVPVLIPVGMSKAIAPYIKNRVVELATWARFSLSSDFEIGAVPAKHQGGRFLIPYRYRTCHGYVISHKGENIYFAGDTAYDNHFSKISTTFPLKLSLLPFGHMTFGNFVRAWEDLGKPDCIPIHWETFFWYLKTKEGLKAALDKASMHNPEFQNKLHILEPGENLTL